jgi:hypothetical protein
MLSQESARTSEARNSQKIRTSLKASQSSQAYAVGVIIFCLSSIVGISGRLASRDENKMPDSGVHFYGKHPDRPPKGSA